MMQIIKIRANTEKIPINDDSVAKLSEIGVTTTLRLVHDRCRQAWLSRVASIHMILSLSNNRTVPSGFLSRYTIELLPTSHLLCPDTLLSCSRPHMFSVQIRRSTALALTCSLSRYAVQLLTPSHVLCSDTPFSCSHPHMFSPRSTRKIRSAKMRS